MLRNSASRYGLIHQSLHWLMALAVIGMFAFGLWMVDLPLGPDKFYWYGLHKSVGSLLLAFVGIRLLWRLTNQTPKLPETMAWHERFGAHGAHVGLYILMAAMPLSGWIMSSAAGFPVSVFGWFTLPDLVAPDKELSELANEAHELMGFAIIGLASVHGLAALYHHFIKKDDILRRMLPWSKC